MLRRVTILIVFLLVVFPFFAYANNGLVPCGPEDHLPDCELCHLFVVFNNVIGLFMKVLIPGAATILIIYGGFNMYMASANPELFNKGKKIIFAAIGGVLIAYFAWAILGLFLSTIGIAEIYEFQNWWQDGFYRIDC